MIRRGKEMKLSCSSSIERSSISFSILFLTPESMISEGGKVLISDLFGRGRLGRIFVDEVHLFSLQSDFRSSLRSLSLVQYFGMPMTVLSASCNQDVIADIKDNLFLSKTPKVIQQITLRSNIKYVVKQLNHFNEVVLIMKEAISKLEEQNKIIVFLQSIDKLNNLSALLNAENVIHSRYYASFVDKSEEMNNWMNQNEIQMMIASSAFGLGIDYPSVRFVFNLGLPFSFDDYIQQSGRGGRDGKLSISYLLFEKHENPNNWLESLSKRDSFKVMFEYAREKQICRRRMISEYFDRIQSCCYDSSTYEKCDNCEQDEDKMEIESLKSTKFVQAVVEVHSNAILSEMRHRQMLISKEEEMIIKLKKYVNHFKNFCCVCYFKFNKNEMHSSRDCLALKKANLCFVCAGNDHGYLNCKFKNIFPKEHCNMCFLSTTYHVDCSYGLKCTNVHNVLKYFILIIIPQELTNLNLKSSCSPKLLKIHEFFCEFMSRQES